MPELPAIRIHHENPHLLETSDGRPFFLLGDTAWELLHRLTREEIDHYLENRASKGFNLICTVLLAEFEGLTIPNAEGEIPLLGLDPHTPNPRYFDLVDYFVERCQELGLYAALLPTWGDKLTAPWGAGPRIFEIGDEATCREYGSWLGKRYGSRSNVMWILGGDRPARLDQISKDWSYPWDAGFDQNTDWTPLWAAMSEGIRSTSTQPALNAYHPQGGSLSSSQLIHQESWLDINMIQSGHGGGHDVPIWQWIERDYALNPAKPTLDSEPNYEDSPVNPWPTYDPANGFFDAYDVRKQCYRSVFAGGCGVVYGNHCIWQFYDSSREPVLVTRYMWKEALDRPGAFGVGHLKRLVDEVADGNRIPDDSVVLSDQGEGPTRMCALRDAKSRYAMVYCPSPGRLFCIDSGVLGSNPPQARWFNPRTAEWSEATIESEGVGQMWFQTPGNSYDPSSDWVLVLQA